MPKVGYDDISFVIPTVREPVHTLKSVPPECVVYVEREGTENVARNRGIRKASTRYIALCDDDIAFDREFLNRVLSLSGEGIVVWLEDSYPLRWLISRFMLLLKPTGRNCTVLTKRFATGRRPIFASGPKKWACG